MSAKAKPPEIVQLSAAQLERLLIELRAVVAPATYQLVDSLLRTLVWIMGLLERKQTLHQQQSQPIMDGLHQRMKDQIQQKQVEPNSGLGQAIAYMLKRWEPLTRFLSVPGAPLDNNLCERALKMTILHRKNSLGFKTLRGAKVGDVFMSLIHTCHLNGVNPFHYLMSLQQHANSVRKALTKWLPWNYLKTLETLDTG